jgi:hypothetical protein
MTTEYIDKMFNPIHSLTLCIEVEIATTELFLKTELEYSTIQGYTTQIELLTGFAKLFDQTISNPFYTKVFNPIMKEMDNPNSMDFLFGYSYLKDFFIQFGKANRVLVKHFKDSYTLKQVNNNINNSYPNIEHNEELFPHQNLAKFFTEQKMKG